MKLALLARVRHGALYRLLREMHWSQAELARRIGVTDGTVSSWMRFQSRPTDPTVIDHLTTLTGCSYQELFPDEVYATPPKHLGREVVQYHEVTAQELQAAAHIPALPPPEDLLLRQERETLLATLLEQLPEREAFVLRAYYGLDDAPEQSLESIRRSLGLSRERIRQIEYNARRHLRQFITQRRLQDTLQET